MADPFINFPNSMEGGFEHFGVFVTFKYNIYFNFQTSNTFIALIDAAVRIFSQKTSPQSKPFIHPPFNPGIHCNT